MKWLPAASEDVVNAARQLLSSETFPSTFVPSVKLTVPVGVPTELSQRSTFAMKVTGSPYLIELLVEARSVKVEAAAPAMVDSGDTSAPQSTNKTVTATRSRRDRDGSVSAGRL